MNSSLVNNILYDFFYEVFQVNIGQVELTDNVITGFRFWHHIQKNGEGRKRLYVIDMNNLYALGESYVTKNMIDSIGIEILYEYIQKSLGNQQIKHMENLLKEDYQLHINNLKIKQNIPISYNESVKWYWNKNIIKKIIYKLLKLFKVK